MAMLKEVISLLLREHFCESCSEMIDLALFDNVWFKAGIVVVAYLVVRKLFSKPKTKHEGNC